MDLTNLSQAEKAMLAFCGVFVVIFSSVMYYFMIIQPNQAASVQDAPPAAYSEARPGKLAADTLAPAASLGANNGVASSR